MSSEKKFKYDIVADKILAEIADGKYCTGSKLPSETELTVQYNVCRVTLRESLKKLNMMGILSIVQGDGTYVNEIRPSEFMKPLFPMMAFKKSNIEEIYDARIFIESGASELAAKRRTEEDIRILRELLENMEDAIGANDKESYSQYDKAFHTAIQKAAGNQTLFMIYGLFDQIMEGYILKINVNNPVVQNSMLDHQQIFEAINQKRAEFSRITMSEHLRKSKEILLRNLNEGRITNL